MNVQTQTRTKSRTELTRQRLRNRPDSFLPSIDGQRVFGLGYGHSSGYANARDGLTGQRSQFCCR